MYLNLLYPYPPPNLPLSIPTIFNILDINIILFIFSSQSEFYADEEAEDDEFYDDDPPRDDIHPSQFPGNGGDQQISYMVAAFKQQLENQLKTNISEKRQKGKAPSREHPSHSSKQPRKRSVEEQDDVNTDPTFEPEQFTGRGRGRGRGTSSRGRGRGGRERGRGSSRGRGRGGNSSSTTNKNQTSNQSSSSDCSRGKHWKKPELRALLTAANHLKPVLKGKFKHSSDGKTMKALAWEELSGNYTK